MKKHYLAKTTAAIAGLALMAATPAFAGTITHWDMSNVTVTPPPYTLEEIYDSTLFTDASKTISHGAVYWKESDIQAPGLQVINNDVLTGDNCLMTTGYNPETGAAKTCSDPFQESKRWKVKTYENQPVDIYFNVIDDRVRKTYRSIQKLTNATDGRLKGFTMELGFMVNGQFVPSTTGDGLGFSNRSGKMFEGTVTYNPDKPDELSAFFPFDIAGEPDQWRDEPGYFDPINRMYIDLEATQNKIVSTGISQNHYDILGDWHNVAGVPIAMFFDGDDHPELMAHCEWDYNPGSFQCLGDWVSYRSCFELDQDDEPCDSDGIRKVVPRSIVDSWLADADYYVDFFDDVANLTLNYFITVDRRLSWPTPGQFVLRTITIASDEQWSSPGNGSSSPPPVIEDDIDVVVSAVTIPRLKRNETGSISVMLNNRFNGAANGALNLVVTDQAGKVLDTYATSFTTTADGSSTTLNFPWKAPSYRTTVTVTATAVAEGDIDPANNTLSASQRIN